MMKPTSTAVAVVFGILTLAAPRIEAQTQTPNPAAYVNFIKSQRSPAQLKDMIAAASPTAWKLIQDRAKTNPGSTFSLADFQNLPESERQALIQAFTPLVQQAQSQGVGSGSRTNSAAGARPAASPAYATKRYY
jgi:arginine utilization protein RocB